MSSLTKLLDVALLRISEATISHKRPLIRILTNNADYDRYFCLEKKSVFILIDIIILHSSAQNHRFCLLK